MTKFLSLASGGAFLSTSQCAPVCWLMDLIVSPPIYSNHIYQIKGV